MAWFALTILNTAGSFDFTDPGQGLSKVYFFSIFQPSENSGTEKNNRARVSSSFFILLLQF